MFNYRFADSVLLVFSKAPVPGQVKTRLQPALSAEQATEAHCQLVHMTLQRAVQEPLCPVVLCCTPDIQHAFFQSCAQRYSVKLSLQQGESLGERMHYALSEALAQYRRAVLIGCDCPSLTVEDLQQAFYALDRHDLVIAPALDGGYVLIGLNQAQPQLFSEIPWSTPQVYSTSLLRAAQLGLSYQELTTQWDVDRIEDWQRYLAIQDQISANNGR